MALATLLCGCRTVGFYAQAVHGEYALLAHQHKVETLLADPRTPADLKHRLQLARDLCRFAEKELGLEAHGNYAKYVDVHREFVVWNVEAAPEFSLAPKRWWYPFLGHLTFRGYFAESNARGYAQTLDRAGYDTCLGGVPAYSTLGWFKDPLLNTFLFEPEPELAETLFHELAHQRLFIPGNTDFNEAFATAVGEEGARRWLQARGDSAVREAYEAGLRRTRQFARLIQETRERLRELYGDEFKADGQLRATTRDQGLARETLRRRKQALLDDLRERYAALKAGWGGNPEYDAWFAAPLNNARLNSVATYYDLVPGFERLLVDHEGQLEDFFQAVDRLAQLPRNELRKTLLSTDPQPSAAGLRARQ